MKKLEDWTPEELLHAFQKSHDMDLIPNGKRNHSKYTKFRTGMELFREIGGKISGDNPDDPLGMHWVTIDLPNELGDKEKVQKLSAAISGFDYIYFKENPDPDKITIQLIMEDMYTKP